MALQSGVTLVPSVSFPNIEDGGGAGTDVLTLMNNTDFLLLMTGSDLLLMN